VVCVVERDHGGFKARKFFLFSEGGEEELSIGAFNEFEEMKGEILGEVMLTQVPWVSSMKSTKTGFLESDEYC